MEYPCTPSRFAQGQSSGRVLALAGTNGSLIFELTSVDPFDRFGADVAFAGDLNGDGLDDLVVGVPQGSGTIGQHGLARVFLSGAPVPRNYCFAAANSTGIGARIRNVGAASLVINEMALTVADLPAGEPGLFFYGTLQVQVFRGDGFLCAGGRVARLGPPLMADAAGRVTRALDFAVAPLGSGPHAVMAGQTSYFQYWYRDPLGPLGTGTNLSDGLEVTFVP